MAPDAPDPREAAQELALTLALELDGEGLPVYTIAEIADRCGYSPPIVGKWLGEARREGLQIPALRARPDPRRREARELRARGFSLPEVAEKVGVSAETARRWCLSVPLPRPAPEVQVPAVELAPEVPTASEDPELDDLTEEGISTLESTQRLQKAMMRAARAAERDGMHQVAQRYYRDATNLTSTIARLEAMASQKHDGIHVTKEEIDTAWSKVESAILAITDRPLLCAQCSQNLSISWAGRDSLEP